MQAQLDALIQTRVREDGDTLNPESITVLDPACGSGHILVVAYDVLKGIYLERGYQPRAIPRLILEKNLYGLDIDDRAAQMAGFALLMKARADDRHLLDRTPILNVLSLQESSGFDLNELSTHLQRYGIKRELLADLLNTFTLTKTFGSLIKISQELRASLPTLAEGLRQGAASGDLYAQTAALDVLPLARQASFLGMRFDTVVANPPYMGPKGMNLLLKSFAKNCFPDGKSDLFAMFIERGLGLCKSTGLTSMVTMHNWMFLSSFETLREKLLSSKTLSCMVHMGNGVMGIAFGTAATVFWNKHVDQYESSFSYCENSDIGDSGNPLQFPVKNERLKSAVTDDFSRVPGSPLAYWVNCSILRMFSGKKILDVSVSDGQNITADNDKFVRFWWELDSSTVGRGKKWLTYCKGGEYRKWYGNLENVVDWSPETRAHYRSSERCRIIPENLWYCVGITWSRVSSKGTPNAFRLLPVDTTFDKVGSSIFIKNDRDLKLSLGILNSKLSEVFVPMLNPTIDLQVRDVRNIPYRSEGHDFDRAVENVNQAISIAKHDWDETETSFDHKKNRLVGSERFQSISSAWQFRADEMGCSLEELRFLEEENNRIFINAYGLQDELYPEVAKEQITLVRSDREKDCHRLISYAIGCMMGRYSLDEPGLIYADAGNVGFDSTRYKGFPADADSILPLTDELWFADDAANRVREFLLAVWGAETIDENMAWLAESLGQKGNETPEEAIRRYVSAGFYKDHLQTYKKRPIYWLFSSGKQGAFQCLVYLHRYHEGTLSRMRAEYVVPLTAKMAARIDMMNNDADAATSATARTKINKQIEVLRKKQTELLAFDEKLRHYADMRIQLDLDEGVKVNYGKFGELLDSVKAITGGTGGDGSDD